MRGDGTLVWRLGRFGELDRDVQQTSRYSKRFQTPEGFEFRLRMFANGAGKGNSTHISVFVQMCRTETDPMLPYPFQGLCIVTLYDQNTSRGKKEHFTVKFKTNSSSCFQRPTADFNPENGVAQFVSHELLRAHTNHSDTRGDKPVYMHNNTIFIGAEIRYTNNLLKLFNSPGKNNVVDDDSNGSRKSNGSGRDRNTNGSSISNDSSISSDLSGNRTAVEDQITMDTS
ncbi:TNF receptor-associated factor 5-like [Convolutriloba macropyga]|uniref:TNF receptor-associated factor 5-like n=1 Tax=Convolutriloba macropyga TaxID=536237 RepID=UPI003F524991